MFSTNRNQLKIYKDPRKESMKTYKFQIIYCKKLFEITRKLLARKMQRSTLSSTTKDFLLAKTRELLHTTLIHTNWSLSSLSEADLELQRKSKEEKAAVDKLGRFHRSQRELNPQWSRSLKLKTAAEATRSLKFPGTNPGTLSPIL